MMLRSAVIPHKLGEIIFEDLQPMRSRYFSVTDGQTDGWTTCRSNTALCLASRDKKNEGKCSSSTLLWHNPQTLTGSYWGGATAPLPKPQLLGAQAHRTSRASLGTFCPSIARQRKGWWSELFKDLPGA